MSTQIQRRRGTTVQHSSFTGAVGETTIDTDKEVVVVHDGVQVGGYPMMRENGSNSALALGSAGTPSLKFTGDTNTGIYSPGADQVAISTNGAGRLFVDANGRVALGGTTVTDSNLFNIQGSTATHNVGVVLNKTNGTPQVWGIQNGGSLTFFNYTSSTTALTIDTSNRVGLGTSSPGSKLTVDIGGRANPSATGSTTQSNAAFQIAATSDTNTKFFAGINTSSRGWLQVQNTADNGTNDILLNPIGGNVGIGNNAPDNTLSLGAVGSIDQDANSVYIGNNFTSTGANFKKTGNYAQQLMFDTATGSLIYKASASTGTAGNAITFSERFRCDSAGRLLVGTNTARTGFFEGGVDPLLQVEGSTTPTSSLSVTRNSNDADGPRFIFGRSRGTGNTVVQSGDRIGGITYQGNDGAKFVRAAEIECYVDATPGTNDMPGRLVFSTTADGASSPTERMRIKANGVTCIGTSTEGTMSGDTVVAIGPNIGIISKSASGVATSGTVDININTGGGGYQGFLVVSNTDASNGSVRTHTTFSVFGRGTDSSIQQIATDNGTTSGASFTVTTPTNGVIRVTNTSAGSRTVHIQFFGGTSF